MSAVRAFFALFATVAALLALAQHLGLDLWNCATCSMVSDMPMSGLMAWVGPIALGILTYGLHKDLAWAKTGIAVAAIASIGLITWMLRHHTMCTLCMLTHIGVLAGAAACLPRVSKVAGPAFALAVAFTATGGWEPFTSQSGVGIFRPRDRETIPSGRVFVLFTDPECSRCHLVESQIENLRTKPSILIRWMILPQNAYRSIRAAALLESARISNDRLFQALHSDLSHQTPPLTDEVLTAMAQKHVQPGQITDWLESPPDRALVAIEEDQTTASELGIQSLPALAELSAPDRAGMRTLRRVPFSEIGL
jgi:hypothetical protein